MTMGDKFDMDVTCCSCDDVLHLADRIGEHIVHAIGFCLRISFEDGSKTEFDPHVDNTQYKGY